jgi:tRNA(Ile)-lysidine synthase
MLQGAAALRERGGWDLYCVHVNHGIRSPEECGADERAVQALSASLGIPCLVRRLRPLRIAAAAKEQGMEGAARLFRHRVFRKERRRIRADRILLAHTASDRAENSLIRILRGAGPAGLSPLPLRRGPIVRPLIELSRQEVLRYLEARGLPYQTDSSNSDNAMLRNRIRNLLIPLLDREFPFWQSGITRLGEQQKRTAEFLKAETLRLLPPVLTARGIEVPEAAFFAQPVLIREEAVFLAADRLFRQTRAGDPGDFWPDEGGIASPYRGKELPRRSIAPFCRGETRAAETPFLRLERKDGLVRLSLPSPPLSERGFAALIKEPGLYTLAAIGNFGFAGSPSDLGRREYPEGVLIRVCREGDEGPADIQVFAGERAIGSFRASLPLVFRDSSAAEAQPASRTGGMPVLAEDAQGPAALLCAGQEGRLDRVISLR